MRSFWSDPYLWIHLTGLAASPLFLEGCLVGLAVGDPFLPVWLELLLIAAVGSAPILWMQWQRPFYIFSLVAVSVKPDALTDDQRRLLTLFKLPRNRVLAVLVSVALIVVLRQVYEVAPIAASVASLLPASHFMGLLLAAVAFLACNLFVQVPVSVASVMLSNQSAFAATLPYPLEKIRRNFTLVGLQLNQIVPPVRSNTKPMLARADRANVGQPVSEAIATTQSTHPTELLTDDLWAKSAPTSGAPLTARNVEKPLSEDAAAKRPSMERPDPESSSKRESPET
ncbi:MAG: low-complexity tail membrane protein [Verrucomicrobia bacterium]|nr:low-complexity tail membrane protein [Leptolyngbya sp. ES-bin-22]